MHATARPPSHRPGTRYRVAARLRIEHGYFAPEPAANFVLRPDAPTARAFARFDMRLRALDDGAELIAAEGALAALANEGDTLPEASLILELHSVDPLCAYYTDLRVLAEAGIYRPDPQHPTQLISMPTPCPASAPAPLARIALPLAALPHTAEHDPMLCTLNLPARQTYWRYLVLGPDAPESLQLVDVDARIEFEAGRVHTVGAGRASVVFTARRPLTLQQRPRHRFQLRRRQGASERVLMPRLPMPSPASLQRESRDGAMVDVSEIYVSL